MWLVEVLDSGTKKERLRRYREMCLRGRELCFKSGDAGVFVFPRNFLDVAPRSHRRLRFMPALA
jgi:hypothetical protein